MQSIMPPSSRRIRGRCTGEPCSRFCDTSAAHTSMDSSSVAACDIERYQPPQRYVRMQTPTGATARNSRRSTTGWLLQLANCWIDWNCHKQDTVALSSCEAEYMAMGSATQAVLWTSSILRELDMIQGDRNAGGDASSASAASAATVISLLPATRADAVRR